jgi:Neuraminidase (sialidase)
MLPTLSVGLLTVTLIAAMAPEVHLVLAPSAANPRNSEGDFAVLRDGRILFVYTHFTGGGADDAAAHLAARVSADGGKTWSERDEPVPAVKGARNTMSVSLLRLRSGELALFYLVKHGWDDCRLYVQVSADEARTWGEPTPCMADKGYYVVNNDRVIQLAGGRLVAPAAWHRPVPGRQFNPRATAVCFLSDDGGKSWRRGKGLVAPPEQGSSGLQEPGVVELKDGRLMMLCRTDLGSQYRCYSDDGGETWSAAEPTDLQSPLSPASVERVPSTGDLLLVWNDHSGVDAKLKGKRTPLCAAVSRDEGKTWSAPKVIEGDPDGWYCYTAIEFVGDRVLLAYCAGKGRGEGLNTTHVTSLPVTWLYAPRRE